MGFANLPAALTNIISLAFGLVIGSFINVVVIRLPHRRSLVHPGSRCPGCDKPIAWWDNIPVLSYVLLRGRCRRCKTKISIRYPLIELMTGLLFLAANVRLGFDLTLVVRGWPWLASLVAIAFIDLEHRIIPDPLSLGGLAWGLLTAWLDPRVGLLSAALGAALGFGFFYSIAWIYLRLTGRSGLGGGDIKLLAMFGAFLGPMGVLTSVVISSIFGSLVGVGWGLARKNRAGGLMAFAIPYGPFLVVGALYYYLFGGLLSY